MTATIINKSTYDNAKKALHKLKSRGTTANKLKAVISAYKNGIKKVSEVFDVHPTSIHRWAKQINDGNLDLLVNDSKLSDGIKLKQIHKNQIKNWLNEDPNYSINKIKDMLFSHFYLLVSKSTVHRAMKSVGFSYITPRKNHYKQDKKEVGRFKKNSNQK